MRLLITTFLWLLPATLLGQLERFEEKDLGKLATIANTITSIEGFDLTADQWDQLSRASARFNHLSRYGIRTGMRATENDYRSFLQTTYDILDEKQEVRLHQVFLQRFMNRDDLKTPLVAFAPDEITDLGRKLSELQKHIDAKLKETISKLPEIDIHNRDQTKVGHARKELENFLDWRWKLQTRWLRDELGEDRAVELLGEPILLGYVVLDFGRPGPNRLD